MRNQQLYGYNPSREYSPLRESILRVDDIEGARPRLRHVYKNTAHYENRLANNHTNNVFEANLQMHEKLYAMGNYHQGYNPAFSNKKHYIMHQESEIARTGVLNGRESAPPDLHYADFPRNLTTNDIPGATPGTLQSKTVKNHDLAPKLRVRTISPTPVPIPASKDNLDKVQNARNVTEEDYKFNIPAKDSYPVPRGPNFHFTQNPKNNEERASISPENYYSTPTVVTQQDLKETNQNDSSFNDGKKSRHVAFKEEPREHTPQPEEQQQDQFIGHPTPQRQISPYREHVPQPEEQQGQFRGHPTPQRHISPYREQPNQNLQRDYLDSYIAQNRESTRQYTGYDESLHEYPVPPHMPNPRPSYQSKKEELEQLSREILIQQQALERKTRESTRNRAFNIISNAPMSRFQLENHRKAYGSSIKALTKNQEDFSRAYAPLPERNISSRQGDLSSHSYLESRRANYAGGMNDYLDASFRNAHNNSAQLPPISQAQYYGNKAIKNLQANNSMKSY